MQRIPTGGAEKIAEEHCQGGEEQGVSRGGGGTAGGRSLMAPSDCPSTRFTGHLEKEEEKRRKINDVNKIRKLFCTS